MPETEVPGPGMLAKVRRPKPYLYSRQEIERLIAAASLLRPKGSLRPHTYATLIGLIASTGLRVTIGSALKFQNLSDRSMDLCVTTSLISSLDVIVSVDTMVAHLAGALGKKVYLLLHTEADWR